MRSRIFIAASCSAVNAAAISASMAAIHASIMSIAPPWNANSAASASSPT